MTNAEVAADVNAEVVEGCAIWGRTLLNFPHVDLQVGKKDGHMVWCHLLLTGNPTGLTGKPWQHILLQGNSRRTLIDCSLLPS